MYRSRFDEICTHFKISTDNGMRCVYCGPLEKVEFDWALYAAWLIVFTLTFYVTRKFFGG